MYSEHGTDSILLRALPLYITADSGPSMDFCCTPFAHTATHTHDEHEKTWW